jgi:prepilin-type processing-associated H-X9-DG protein
MIMKTSDRLAIEKTGAGGFTLVELAVVIATLAVLIAVLLPAIAGTRPNAQAFQCLENQRQLILAWQMYAQDNSDILPPNDFPWKTQESRNGTEKNWVFGSMLVPLDMINTSLLVNPQLSSLALYNTNPAAYKCPADIAVVQNKVRARSVSMNCAVGTRWYSAGLGSPGGSHTGPVGSPVGGGWLSGIYSDPDPNYRTYGKITQMTKPGPSMTWVIIDENPDTINDPLIAISMNANLLVDLPAKYHNGGAGMSFADGHAEIHKWTDDFAQALPPGTITGQGNIFRPVPPSHDTAWLQPRTSARK